MKQQGQGKLIFFLATLVFTSAIALTTLLANSQKNLNFVMQWLGLSQIEAPRAVQSGGNVKDNTPKALGPKDSGERILISPSGSAPFARKVSVPISRLCALFAQHGYTGDGWDPATNSSFRECSGEKIMHNAQAPASAPGSVFFHLRGTENEDFLFLRIKILAPPDETGVAAKDELNAILKEVIRSSGWSDLEGFMQQVKSLHDVSNGNFGVEATFRQEFTNPHAYNLIIRPVSQVADPKKLERPMRQGAFQKSSTP